MQNIEFIFKKFYSKNKMLKAWVEQKSSKLNSIISIITISSIALLWSSQQAMAHHMMGGKLPTNFVEGFISGLGHPLVGLDHFAFIIASGLIAAGQTNGIFIPIAFVITAMLGTGIHLQQVNLPLPEMVIAISVVAFGAFLAIENNRQNRFKLSPLVLIAIAAIAGIFHGYAYGEAIVGAQPSPLVAYLIGFTLIQSLIALTALAIGKIMLQKIADRPSSIMRFVGIAIGTIGTVFLASALFV
jgi:urease accessory protein